MFSVIELPKLSMHDSVDFNSFLGKAAAPIGSSSAESGLIPLSYYVSWPHSTLAWSYYSTSETIIAVYGFGSGPCEKEAEVLVRELARCAEVAVHPMLPAIAAHRAIARTMTEKLYTKGTKIASAQRETEYTHPQYGMRLVGPSDQEIQEKTAEARAKWEGSDWAKLSADIMQAAADMVTDQLDWHALKDLALWILQESRTSLSADQTGQEEGSPASKAAANVQKEAEHLVRASNTKIREAEALQQKASILLQGLFNLVAQRDQNTNLQIARETKQLAKIARLDSVRSIEIADDLRTVANESKRDSTSIKAIAAVTMFFLPGTFVAVSSLSLILHSTSI